MAQAGRHHKVLNRGGGYWFRCVKTPYSKFLFLLGFLSPYFENIWKSKKWHVFRTFSLKIAISGETSAPDFWTEGGVPPAATLMRTGLRIIWCSLPRGHAELHNLPFQISTAGTCRKHSWMPSKGYSFSSRVYLDRTSWKLTIRRIMKPLKFLLAVAFITYQGSQTIA